MTYKIISFKSARTGEIWKVDNYDNYSYNGLIPFSLQSMLHNNASYKSGHYLINSILRVVGETRHIFTLGCEVESIGKLMKINLNLATGTIQLVGYTTEIWRNTVLLQNAVLLKKSPLDNEEKSIKIKEVKTIKSSFSKEQLKEINDIIDFKLKQLE